MNIRRHFSLVTSAIFMIVVLSSAALAQFITNTTFESDTLNSTPRTALGTNPSGWSISSEVNNANGVVDASVISGGSPFSGGGSKSLLIYDNNATDSRMTANAAFSSTYSGASALQISFDILFNQSITAGLEAFVIRLYGQGTGSGDNATSVNNIGIKFANGVVGGVGTGTVYLQNLGGATQQVLNVGEWYKITLITAAPGAATGSSYSFNATTYSTSVTSSWYTSTTGLTGNNGTLSDFRGLTMVSGFSATGKTDLQLDNFSVTAVPEPSTVACMIIGISSLAALGYIRSRLNAQH